MSTSNIESDISNLLNDTINKAYIWRSTLFFSKGASLQLYRDAFANKGKVNLRVLHDALKDERNSGKLYFVQDAIGTLAIVGAVSFYKVYPNKVAMLLFLLTGFFNALLRMVRGLADTVSNEDLNQISIAAGKSLNLPELSPEASQYLYETLTRPGIGTLMGGGQRSFKL